MNAVPYIAPFALFDLDAAAFSEAEWKACRKKILAEFELSGNAAITWKDRSFDKSTLLQLLDEVHEPEARAFHLAVQNDPLLFRLLTTYDPLVLADKTTEHDPHLLKKCLPYLAYACGQAICIAFQRANRAALMAVYHPHPLFPAPVLQHIWNPLHVYLLRTGEQLLRETAKQNDRKTVRPLYEKYMLPVSNGCMQLLPAYLKSDCEMYIRAMMQLSWQLPHNPQQAAQVCKLINGMHDILPRESAALRNEIPALYNRLSAAELLPRTRSRILLVASFLPILLLLLTSIIFVNGGGNTDTVTPQIFQVFRTGTILITMLSVGFLVAAFRYTWRNRNTISGWWFFGLLLLNLLVFPLFWLFFIRHPKDRAGNILSIVLIGITLVLVFVRGAMKG